MPVQPAANKVTQYIPIKPKPQTNKGKKSSPGILSLGIFKCKAFVINKKRYSFQ